MGQADGWKTREQSRKTGKTYEHSANGVISWAIWCLHHTLGQVNILRAQLSLVTSPPFILCFGLPLKSAEDSGLSQQGSTNCLLSEKSQDS